jgi:glycogen debranching enzyme
LVHKGYEEAKKLLRSACTEEGFTASLGGLYGNDVWGRDGSITCLGASLTEDEELIGCSKRTLTTLEQAQGPLGQIPNRVRIRPRSVNFYARDAAPWWIIAVMNFWMATQDSDFLSKMWPSVKKAITWLKYQNIDTTGLITSPPAADWMDSSLQRWGTVLYNNVLYYKALLCVAELAKALGKGEKEAREARKVKARINTLFWPEKKPPPDEWIPGWNMKFYEEVVDPDRHHYLNFLSFESYDWHCDVLSNCLAILWGVADQQKAGRILKYTADRNLSVPFPIRVLDPVLLNPTPFWNPKIDLYRPALQQNLPFQYHNAACWPWVGGFYVLTLEKAGRHKQAQEELEKLAQANSLSQDQDWEFNEWLHGKTGTPMGTRFEAWSAAGYILAYRAVQDHRSAI